MRYLRTQHILHLHYKISGRQHLNSVILVRNFLLQSPTHQDGLVDIRNPIGHPRSIGIRQLTPFITEARSVVKMRSMGAAFFISGLAECFLIFDILTQLDTAVPSELSVVDPVQMPLLQDYIPSHLLCLHFGFLSFFFLSSTTMSHNIQVDAYVSPAIPAMTGSQDPTKHRRSPISWTLIHGPTSPVLVDTPISIT